MFAQKGRSKVCIKRTQEGGQGTKARNNILPLLCFCGLLLSSTVFVDVTGMLFAIAADDVVVPSVVLPRLALLSSTVFVDVAAMLFAATADDVVVPSVVLPNNKDTVRWARKLAIINNHVLLLITSFALLWVAIIFNSFW